MKNLIFALSLFTVIFLGAAPAWGEIDLKVTGWISADIRYRIAGEPRYDVGLPSQWQLLKNGFSRNENRIRAALALTLSPKIKAVADAELALYGFSDLKDLDSTTLRERVDPYYLEVHGAYIDINNLLPHVDLRIGRQVVPWGAADKFNPVSNINTLDLSDPLLFGKALANNMIKLDWNPFGDLIFTAVAVPIFRPAQLPRSAPVALLDPLRPAPVTDQAVRAAIDAERAMVYNGGGSLTINAQVLQPEVSFANAQYALRAAAKLLGQDVALSYYHGRFGIPTSAWTVADRAPGGKPFDAQVMTEVVYPRVDILGVEGAGSIEKLGGAGWWAEAAVNFPQPIGLAIYEGIQNPFGPRTYLESTLGAAGVTLPLGTPVCPGNVQPVQAGSGKRPTCVTHPLVVESTPFVKATLGADYAIGGHVYLNLQYVHGFIDEFGAGRAARPRRDATDIAESPRVESRIGDYLVGGVDVKVLSERLLFRLFAVLKLPSYDANSGFWDDYAPTGVLFPQIIWHVWDGTELTAGSFVLLGDRSTKFGDPAAGATEVFVKGKVSF